MLRETRIFVHHRIFYSRVRPSPSPHALATDSHAAAAAATLAPTNAKSLRPSATHDRRNGLVRSSSSPFLDDAAIGKVNCACAAWIRRRADRRLPPPRGVRMRRHGLFPAPQPVDLLKFDDKASGLASESEPLARVTVGEEAVDTLRLRPIAVHPSGRELICASVQPPKGAGPRIGDFQVL
ncbi:hypothetical protein BDA96_10G295500 [Sorghum bicolor]|uniref:Uncharacterized protein n=1 Tax=Sorghum bicolor TaxID=4558 RepID=A0A921U2H9_SORBI|nr:hypothetical protein BDA96_10G295500 [Sorghum bicolor]